MVVTCPQNLLFKVVHLFKCIFKLGPLLLISYRPRATFIRHCLGMVFTSDGKRSEEIATRAGKSNAVLRELHRCVHTTGALKHRKSVNFWIFGNDWKNIISRASSRNAIFAKSTRRDTSRQSAQLWIMQSPEFQTTSPNREIPATLVQPCVQNVPRKTGEASPAV